MAVLRMQEIRKLSPAEAEKKLAEMESIMLELAGSGKLERQRPVRQAIARLKTYLHGKKRNA